MTKAENAEWKKWVNGLKPGDEVSLVPGNKGAPVDGVPTRYVVTRDYFINGRKVICVVNRSIPESAMMSKGISFDEGYLKGYPRSSYHSLRRSMAIVPITDEHRRHWKAKEVVTKIRTVIGSYGHPSGLTDDQLLRIGAILDEGKETE